MVDVTPMNPRDSSRAAQEAVRSFSSRSNAIFFIVLAVILVIYVTFFAVDSEDQPNSDPSTTTLEQTDT